MNIIRHILMVLVFFPSVTFGLLSAEIFPWGILFAIVSIRRMKRSDAVLTALLLSLLFLSATWSLLRYPQSDAIRSGAAYLNVIATFVAFLSLSPVWMERARRFAGKLLIALIVLGLAQYLGLMRPVEGVIQMLVPRASGGLLTSQASRGVTLLASEPSRAGVELTLLYFISRMTHRTHTRFALQDLAFLAYLAVVIRAAQPVAFAVLIIGMLVVRKPIHALPFLFAIALTPLIDLDMGNSRVIDLLQRVGSQGTFADAMLMLISESGPRLVTIYAFYLAGIVHPFGMGVGSWPISSILAIQNTGFDVSQISYFRILGDGGAIAVRGSGVLTNLMLDIGVIGTGYFVFWILRLTRRLRVANRDSILVMTVLFVKIGFVGSVGEPLPWVATALILHYQAARYSGRTAAKPEPAPPIRARTAQPQP